MNETSPYLSADTPIPDSKDHYILKFDGSCWPNPGPMAIGYVIQGPHRKPIVRLSAKIGEGTCNLAEYAALLEGLRHCARIGIRRLTVLGDSLLVINQILGKYKVKKGTFKGIHNEILEVSKMFAVIHFGWVDRRDNTDADEVSKLDVDYKLEGPSGMDYRGYFLDSNSRTLTEQQAGICQLMYLKGIITNLAILSRVMQVDRSSIYLVARQESHSLLTEDIFSEESKFLIEANNNPLPL